MFSQEKVINCESQKRSESFRLVSWKFKWNDIYSSSYLVEFFFLLSKILWQRYYGKDTVAKNLWLKNINTSKRSINRPPCVILCLLLHAKIDFCLFYSLENITYYAHWLFCQRRSNHFLSSYSNFFYLFTCSTILLADQFYWLINFIGWSVIKLVIIYFFCFWVFVIFTGA